MTLILGIDAGTLILKAYTGSHAELYGIDDFWCYAYDPNVFKQRRYYIDKTMTPFLSKAWNFEDTDLHFPEKEPPQRSRVMVDLYNMDELGVIGFVVQTQDIWVMRWDDIAGKYWHSHKYR